jgi:hypothetical protein
MQLHTARLCLDCQEVHDGQSCPVCLSESFAYLSRWVPAPERRQTPRATPPTSEEAEVYRQLLNPEASQQKSMRWLKRGALGLTVVSLAGWLWRRSGEAGGSNGPARSSDAGTRAR